MSRLSLYSLVLLAGVGSAVVACGSDDDNPVGAAGTGGKAAGTGGKSTAGSAGKPAASGGASGAGEAGETGEGGEAGAADTLYTRLGGHAGIATAIHAIVVAELGDDDIASFFAPQLKAGSKHVPSAGQIEACFVGLLSSTPVSGGPDSYPFTLPDGFKCRSMSEAHKDLHIAGGTFDNFVTIAAGVLADNKVAADDIAAIGGVLNSTKEDIVDPAAKDGPCTAAACSSAGAGGEAGGN